MELANQLFGRSLVRTLSDSDRAAVWRLLRDGVWTDQHADWRPIDDWLGSDGFVGIGGRLRLDAFLAVGADPRPAYWVRGVGLARRGNALLMLSRMLDEVTPWMHSQGGTSLQWMPLASWPNQLATGLGFQRLTDVVTYVNDDLSEVRGNKPSSDIEIRSVEAQDFPVLEQIENAAFSAEWRYSAASLALAKAQCLSFDVALISGRLAGFQVSTLSSLGAHLARMTVSPAYQRRGVGTALMLAAIRSYLHAGVRLATLNTQLENIPSQKLYARFGFRLTTDKVPVWTMPL